MKKRINIYLILLFILFTLDLTGFSIKNYILIKGTGFLSINGFLWVTYTMLLLVYFFANKGIEKLMILFLALWSVLEYFKSWNIILNQNFVPKIKFLLPIMYHLMLHTLILISLFAIIKYIFFQKNKTYFEFVIIETPVEESKEIVLIE